LNFDFEVEMIADIGLIGDHHAGSEGGGTRS